MKALESLQMPFKTRRQKIAASQRRYIFAEDEVKISYGKNREPEISKKSDKPYSIKTIDDPLFLKQDLLKIVVISSIIVASQIGLRLTLS